MLRSSFRRLISASPSLPRALPVPNPHRPVPSLHRRLSTPPPHPVLNAALSRLRRVRLISEEGTLVGEMSGLDAHAAARAAGLDALLVTGGVTGRTAVVKMVDYAAVSEAAKRASYDTRKRRKESLRETRKAGTTKQLRLSPATGERDFEMKMRQARRFLVEGYRVRVFMMFRRGQGRLQDEAREALAKAAGVLGRFGVLAGGKKGKVEGGWVPTVQELFPRAVLSEEEKAEAAAANAAGKRVKAKPLEILLSPLKRVDRERLKLEDAAGDGEGGEGDDS